LGHELEQLIEAAEQVQNKGPVWDGFAEIGESISHPLHLAAVVVDGEGALGESAELGVEEHGARFAVVEELLLDAEPCGASRNTVTLVDVVQEVRGDGVEDPRDDHANHT
jgi:hypothetical protein